jgi:hypothetical protein
VRPSVLLPGLGLVAYGLAIALLPPETFHGLVDSEQGPVEFGTAVGFGVACVLALRLAARTHGVAPTPVRILYLLFAAGALFAALEEISYGQHFFAWETPRWFAERNAQQETNLHNLFADRPGRALRNLSLVAVTLGGIVAPVVAMRVPGAYEGGRWPRYLLPRAELIPLAGGMLLMRLFRALPGRVRAGWDLGLIEVMELYLALAAIVYVVVLRRRLLGPPRHRPTPERGRPGAHDPRARRGTA